MATFGLIFLCLVVLWANIIDAHDIGPHKRYIAANTGVNTRAKLKARVVLQSKNSRSRREQLLSVVQSKAEEEPSLKMNYNLFSVRAGFHFFILNYLRIEVFQQEQLVFCRSWNWPNQSY